MKAARASQGRRAVTVLALAGPRATRATAASRVRRSRARTTSRRPTARRCTCTCMCGRRTRTRRRKLRRAADGGQPNLLPRPAPVVTPAAHTAAQAAAAAAAAPATPLRASPVSTIPTWPSFSTSKASSSIRCTCFLAIKCFLHPSVIIIYGCPLLGRSAFLCLCIAPFVVCFFPFASVCVRTYDVRAWPSSRQRPASVHPDRAGLASRTRARLPYAVCVCAQCRTSDCSRLRTV